MTTLYELRQKPHTSISAIKTFIQCPRRYWLQYREHLPPAFKAAAAAFGTAWHAVIGHWLANEGVAMELLEQYFADELKARLEADRVPVLFDDDENEGKL